MADEATRAYIVASLNLPAEKDLNACARKVCTFVVGTKSKLSTALYFRT